MSTPYRLFFSALPLVFALSTAMHGGLHAQAFIHPGIDQSAADLAHMKRLVRSGAEPYRSAFERLKAKADTAYRITPFAHVLRGPYGRPNIGGNDLRKGAELAYDCAILWHVTGDRRYAEKAAAILNAWSPVLWDFDYNDAKLLAAWTGHLLCNAAELLRHSGYPWKQEDQASFRHMLKTVFVPLLRHYFPQANGNWNGAIIHALMAIGIHTDDRRLFNDAVDNYLHAPVNGSLFKYVYPDGQCQESQRDQGHVQLGLGEFSGAAQVAFTQGVDLLSIADHRLALGFEYTAGFLLGRATHCYGTISQREKELRDDYEYIFRHYASKGIDLPWTRMAADSVRRKASRSVLTSVRVPLANPGGSLKPPPSAAGTGYVAGALDTATAAVPGDAAIIEPGASIQEAVDRLAGTSRWIVLRRGIHRIPAALRLRSGLTLCGEGKGTVLFLDPSSADRDAIVNAEDSLKNVTLRDFVVECAPRTEIPSDPNSSRSNKGGYNRGGILLRTEREGRMADISLVRLTVRNATFNGVFINGADRLWISDCDFNENGGSVVPGPRLQHNLLLTRSRNVTVQGCRLATSPYGAGLALDHCNGVLVRDCEIARNAFDGVNMRESGAVRLEGNLVEANDGNGIQAEFLDRGCKDITVSDNRIRYNTRRAIVAWAAERITVGGNRCVGNGRGDAPALLREGRILLDGD